MTPLTRPLCRAGTLSQLSKPSPSLFELKIAERSRSDRPGVLAPDIGYLSRPTAISIIHLFSLHIKYKSSKIKNCLKIKLDPTVYSERDQTISENQRAINYYISVRIIPRHGRLSGPLGAHINISLKAVCHVPCPLITSIFYEALSVCSMPTINIEINFI